MLQLIQVTLAALTFNTNGDLIGINTAIQSKTGAFSEVYGLQFLPTWLIKLSMI